MKTGYSKIDGIIEEAEKLDLAVEVSDHRSDSGGRHLMSYTVEIREQVSDHRSDVLASIQRSRSVWLHWCWFFGNGRTPRLMAATEYGLTSGEQRDLIKQARQYRNLGTRDMIHLAITAMAREQERHP
jgi:hypothetical protein